MRLHVPKSIEIRSWFWHGILIIALSIGVLDLWERQPEQLTGWHGLVVSGLCCLFMAGYAIYSHYYVGKRWQISDRIVLTYTAVQLIIVVVLLTYTRSFLGGLFIISAQITSTISWRRWLIPMGAVVVVLAFAFGIGEAITNQAWADAAFIVLVIALTIGIQAFITTMYIEKYKRERLISELHAAKSELESYALQVEEMTMLRERTRLARDMHDNLGHALVVVNVKLEAAERLYAVEPARGASELQATRGIVREAMQSLRHSLNDLRSPLTLDSHMSKTLQHTISTFQERTQLTLNATLSDLPQLAQPTAEALWYSTREALTNIERHAHAQKVTVQLNIIDDLVELIVCDDGCGMAADAKRRNGHYGVIGMRERVEAAGGSLQIKPNVPQGTTVIVRMPVQCKEQRA